MARKPHRPPNIYVVALLEDLLTQAKEGRITALLTIARGYDGTYGENIESDDVDDMILEARSAIIRLVIDNHCTPETQH